MACHQEALESPGKRRGMSFVIPAAFARSWGFLAAGSATLTDPRRYPPALPLDDNTAPRTAVTAPIQGEANEGGHWS